MEIDDEIVFGRALDESRALCDQIEALKTAIAAADAPNEDTSTRLRRAEATFELHGWTLQRLASWYPGDERARLAALEWEASNLRAAAAI